MKKHTVISYEFKELSKDAQQKALDEARDNEFLGEHVISDAIESLKAFSNHFDLSLNYSVGIYPDRGEHITAKIDNEDVSKLSGIRLFKYINNHYLTALNPYTKKQENIFSGNCTFTGVCYDEDILFVMGEFMKKPDDRDFQSLINDCTSELLSDIHKEGEYLSSDEYLKEDFENHEVEFYDTGKVYH